MEQLLGDESVEVVDDRREVVPMLARGTQELDPRAVREGIAMDVEVGIGTAELAEIVHDLKAPLATIALEVTLLDHRAASGPLDARPALARILQNVDFLDRMVHDLLDGWSSDPRQGPRVSTDLRALLDAVIARSVFTRDRPRVRLDAPTTAWVQVDELRIQRVVANLVSNALKYSPNRSTIIVRLDTYRDHCCVSVIDAGPGITQAEAGFIFDKYRRTQSAQLHDGSGLGLYVSRKIIEDHGGSIGVESTPGVGSRFYFQLALS